jgi:hypothetical protein
MDGLAMPARRTASCGPRPPCCRRAPPPAHRGTCAAHDACAANRCVPRRRTTQLPRLTIGPCLRFVIAECPQDRRRPLADDVDADIGVEHAAHRSSPPVDGGALIGLGPLESKVLGQEHRPAVATCKQLRNAHRKQHRMAGTIFSTAAGDRGPYGQSCPTRCDPVARRMIRLRSEPEGDSGFAMGRLIALL